MTLTRYAIEVVESPNSVQRRREKNGDSFLICLSNKGSIASLEAVPDPFFIPIQGKFMAHERIIRRDIAAAKIPGTDFDVSPTCLIARIANSFP